MFGHTAAEIQWLTLQNYHTGTAPHQPQAATQSSAFPMLTKPKGFTASTEGPSLAKGSKGCRHGPRAGAAWDGARKVLWWTTFIQHLLMCAGGCEEDAASAPSAAGKISGKILKDWIKPNFRWNSGQMSMQHNVMLTWKIILIVKEKVGGEKQKRKSIRVDRSIALKTIVMALKICGKYFLFNLKTDTKKSF